MNFEIKNIKLKGMHTISSTANSIAVQVTADVDYLYDLTKYVEKY